MSTGGTAAATVAMIAGRKRREVVVRLRERGAISRESALTSEELGLAGNPILRSTALSGAVVEVGGRYYLDENALAAQERSQGALILGLLAALMVFLALLWLIGTG